MTNLTKLTPRVLLFGMAASIFWPLTPSARADDPSSQRDAPPQHGPRRPPPEAFSACEGKSEGAACNVTFHERTHEGVCVAPSEEQLFCMPNDMPPPPSGERPDRPPRRDAT